MIAQFANLLILLSTTISFAGIILSFKDISLKITLFSSSVANIFTYFILVYLFISNDFSISSVFFNSSSISPLKYLISASWASHETSLLFWIFCNSVVILIWNIFFSKAKITNIIFLLIQNFFLLILYFKANPFENIASKAKISEGLGLNPLLQDIGILIHPPIIYFSYGLYLLCYSYFINLAFDKNLDQKLISNFSRLAIALLSLAVGLGGWWAYRELGWGGYWFFDPVENISLMVWLFAIGFHHSLIQKDMKITSLFLGIMTYLSIIWGSFFVRSGMLVSVHSFAESNSSLLFLIFSTSLTLFSIITFIYYYKKSDSEKISLKYIWMQSGNLGWSVSGFLILFTLIYPIFYYLMNNKMIEIKEGFFLKSLIPVMVITSLLSGIVYFRDKMIKIFIINFLALFITFILVYFLNFSLIYYLSISVSIAIILGSSLRFFEKYKDQKSSINKPFLSMILGHLSVGLLILSISLNIFFSKEENLVLSENSSKKIWNNFEVKLVNIDYAITDNYVRQFVNLLVLDEKENEITNLKPELRLYQVEKTMTSDVDIFSYVFYDWYGVINKINDDEVNIQIHQRYFISFIWFSILLMFFAFILRLFK